MGRAVLLSMRIGPILLLVLPVLCAAQGTKPRMPDAIEKFKIRTQERGFRADSPQVVNRASPWTAWHGRLYWNIRNDVFDAVPHEVTQTGGEKGFLRRNQYGFSLSGPVIIPKLYHGEKRTFFTVTFEGVRERQGESFLETIATMAERQGDFSQTVDSAGEMLRIFDPASTRLNPDFDPSQDVSEGNLQYMRDQFSGNRVPVDRLDPVALDAMLLYPAPNVSIGPYFENNFTSYNPETNNADGFRVKVDHDFRGRHRLGVGFNISSGLRGPAKVYDSIANPNGADRDYESLRTSVEHIFTISPNSVNTFRVGVSNYIYQNAGGAGDLESAFPEFSFDPYLGMGRDYPASRSSRTYTSFEDSISFRRGSHSIELEGGIWFERTNDIEPRYPVGSFEFNEGLTSLPGIVNTGHGFSSFMLGLSKEAEGSLVGHPSYWRQLDWEAGVSDEWNVRPGLTLSFGFNLFVSRSRIEKYDRQSTVDLEAINPENGMPGALVFANRDGYGRTFQPTRYNVNPYVSVTWSPFEDSKTVIRARFRRRLDGHRMPDGHWGTQGFNGTPTYITQNEQLEPAVILRDGLPAPPIPPPDLRPEAANDTDAYLVDRSGRVPTYHSYRVSIERELPGSFVVSSEFQYEHGWNRNANSDGAQPNAIPLDALQYRDLLNDDDFNRSLRPYPQYRTFNISRLWAVGDFRERNLEVEVEKRTSGRLSLQFSYDYTKIMDNYRGDDGLQDYYNRENEWALAYYNRPHRFSMRYMYEFPFGPGRRFVSGGGWKGTVLGGWRVSGTSSYYSGEPISLQSKFNNTGGVVSALYVNSVPGVDPHVEDQGPELWFNPNAFLNPPDFETGNVSRSHPTLRNPIRQNHDLSLAKRFRLSSERELEFVGTALNFLNHANWNRPDNEIGTLESPNENAGKIIGSRGGRVIQLGVRFSF